MTAVVKFFCASVLSSSVIKMGRLLSRSAKLCCKTDRVNTVLINSKLTFNVRSHTSRSWKIRSTRCFKSSTLSSDVPESYRKVHLTIHAGRLRGIISVLWLHETRTSSNEMKISSATFIPDGSKAKGNCDPTISDVNLKRWTGKTVSSVFKFVSFLYGLITQPITPIYCLINLILWHMCWRQF